MRIQPWLLRAFACSGIAASIVRFSSIYGLGAIDPDYSQVRDFISTLGALEAPNADLMNGSILLFGVLVVLFCIALYKGTRPSVGAALGAAILCISGFAFLAVAFLPCDVGCDMASPSRTMLMHLVFATVAMLCQVLAAIIFAFVYVVDPRHRVFGGISAALGTLALIAIAFFFLADPESGKLGAIQKTYQAAIDLWLIAAGFFVLTKTVATD